MFSVKSQTNVVANIKGIAAQIYLDFKRIWEAIFDTVVPVPPAEATGFTQAETQKYVNDEKMRVIDAFTYAFMVNLLPAEMRTTGKVLEQKPENIANTSAAISEMQKRILDEKCPLIDDVDHHQCLAVML